MLPRGEPAELELDANVPAPSSAAQTAATTHAAPLAAVDDWELDEELRHVQRLLGPWSEDPLADESGLLRADTADARFGHRAGATPTGYLVPRRRGSKFLGFLAGLVMLAGMSALSCGGALMCWGLWQHRDDLWRLGVPLLVVGQLGISVSLALMLDKSRAEGRAAESGVARLDQQLDRISRRLSPPKMPSRG